ncbi:hypothetical protein Cdeb_00449 [Caldibacillus debilis GB1]|uniref:Uncharacterized protein n=1 Tax=Caldibacillus debilis GB1 TaxID=1339248 RepID=A0A420VGQ1_9BACI|nr:hypothetical protein Cdeb_00449 [Caldibacillus debilis GB1]
MGHLRNDLSRERIRFYDERQQKSLNGLSPIEYGAKAAQASFILFAREPFGLAFRDVLSPAHAPCLFNFFLIFSSISLVMASRS